MGQSGEGAVGGARVQEQGPLSLESFLYIAVYFTHIFAYWSFMAAVVPFMETEYSYSTSSIYLYFLFVGVGFVVAYGIYRLLSYKFSEARLVPLSLIVSAGGLMSLYHSDSTPIAIWQVFSASDRRPSISNQSNRCYSDSDHSGLVAAGDWFLHRLVDAAAHLRRHGRRAHELGRSALRLVLWYAFPILCC
jgi:hypothetical protein